MLHVLPSVGRSSTDFKGTPSVPCSLSSATEDDHCRPKEAPQNFLTAVGSALRCELAASGRGRPSCLTTQRLRDMSGHDDDRLCPKSDCCSLGLRSRSKAACALVLDNAQLPYLEAYHALFVL